VVQSYNATEPYPACNGSASPRSRPSPIPSSGAARRTRDVLYSVGPRRRAVHEARRGGGLGRAPSRWRARWCVNSQPMCCVTPVIKRALRGRARARPPGGPSCSHLGLLRLTRRPSRWGAGEGERAKSTPLGQVRPAGNFMKQIETKPSATRARPRAAAGGRARERANQQPPGQAGNELL
jgi:hypothetical protein